MDTPRDSIAYQMDMRKSYTEGEVKEEQTDPRE